MKLEIRSVVPANRKDTWDLVMDIPKAGSCVPGIKEILQTVKAASKLPSKPGLAPWE